MECLIFIFINIEILLEKICFSAAVFSRELQSVIIRRTDVFLKLFSHILRCDKYFVLFHFSLSGVNGINVIVALFCAYILQHPPCEHLSAAGNRSQF